MTNKRIFKYLMIALGCLTFSVQSQSVLGQNSWPIHHPPVNQSVPQYVPRYPLGDAVPTKIPAATKQPPLKSVLPKRTPTQPEPKINKPQISKPKLAKPKPAKPKPKQNTKKPVAKTPAKAKSSDGKKKDPKKKIAPHYGLDYSVYRDTNPIPIDPRKPNNPCLRPECLNQGKCGCNLPGRNGVPYKDREPGGCQCGTKHPGKNPSFSVHWPRPFSAKLDETFPVRASERYCPCQKKRIVDIFDPLSKLKLSKFKRTDRGDCGIGSDPYGCLGESKVFGSAAASLADPTADSSSKTAELVTRYQLR